MEPRRMVLMNSFAGQEQRHSQRSDLWLQWGKKRVRQIQSNIKTQILPYVKQTASGELLSHTGPTQVRCDD